MGSIRRLDPIVANQIAAGEVVERPASVIKELIENSLDAQATQIVVEVRDDEGWTLEVRDNGQGIDAEDLPLAVERHSTSKLTQLSDLETASTLGFRGEALAAIASVSRMAIASRPLSDSIGHRMTVDFGVTGAVQPCPMNVGTRVQVQAVFSRQPARLKALRTPAAEFGTMQHVVQTLAISRADVQFLLTRNGRTILETPGRGDHRATLLALFGRELSAELLPVDYHTERHVTVSGFIAPAHRHRANRLGEALYINSRWVTNWLLRAAVEEAFRPNLPERRYPYFWIWLDVPLSDVDPNAHPTKAEVRLVKEQFLRATLHRAVSDALMNTSAPPTWETAMHEKSTPYQSQQVDWDFSHTPERPVVRRQYQELVPLAQWRAKYIVAQGPEGLCLIDQHAAHERIYYERFRRMGQAVSTSQALLIALPETLSGTEWAVWAAHQADLAAWGFDVQALGGTTVAVRAVPTAFHDLQSHQGLLRTVLQLLDSPEAALHPGHPVSWAEESFYAMAACKAAIKANRPLSMMEMQDLLDEMTRAEDPRACPHGRPTMVVLTLEEVDRRFGRRN
ncbi:MAG: DNA mismatch repair protein MutL [Sulfobacillus acidophilus]|uniref:DNA mismatch repair protein MutL n=1 Tax=Sulfobacillus acidophilus TaxID=53633 RepID=A0A2T2WER1_9FIRM|nr:MAG: DNA mismatch repair protein MutL [Sulfobacillus acidophilus]